MPPDRRPHVLIVEEDREVRAYLVRCLAPLADRLGEIHETGDGLAALALCRRLPIGLAIVDAVVPRLGGEPLARRLAGSPRPPAVVLIANRPGAPARRLGENLVSIPRAFDSRTLCRAVESLIG